MLGAAGAVTVSCRVVWRGAEQEAERNGIRNRQRWRWSAGAELSRDAAPKVSTSRPSASLGSALVVRCLVSVRLVDAVKVIVEARNQNHQNTVFFSSDFSIFRESQALPKKDLNMKMISFLW